MGFFSQPKKRKKTAAYYKAQIKKVQGKLELKQLKSKLEQMKSKM